MAKKQNFDFERREREKAKAAKNAEKTKAKAEKKAGGEAPVIANEPPGEAS